MGNGGVAVGENLGASAAALWALVSTALLEKQLNIIGNPDCLASECDFIGIVSVRQTV